MAGDFLDYAQTAEAHGARFGYHSRRSFWVNRSELWKAGLFYYSPPLPFGVVCPVSPFLVCLDVTAYDLQILEFRLRLHLPLLHSIA